jgi:hypothetical protein
MWPDISPASSALVSFILALISEWPVLYMMGLPPSRRSSSYINCEHFTSPMNVAPGLRVRISRPKISMSRSPQTRGPARPPRRCGPVAVEGDAQLRARFRHLRLQRLEVLLDRRVGMVVREVAVGLENIGTASTFRRSSSVKAWAPAAPLPASNTTFTRRSNRNCPATSSTYAGTASAVEASAPRPIRSPPREHPVHFLNRIAVQRARAQHGLEPVIFRRIVRAGDHHTRFANAGARHVMIQHRRRDHAHVHGVAPARQQARRAAHRAAAVRSAAHRGPEPPTRAPARRRYVPSARPSPRTPSVVSSVSAMPRMSYSRKMVGFNMAKPYHRALRSCITSAR